MCETWIKQPLSKFVEQARTAPFPSLHTETAHEKPYTVIPKSYYIKMVSLTGLSDFYTGILEEMDHKF